MSLLEWGLSDWFNCVESIDGVVILTGCFHRFFAGFGGTSLNQSGSD